MEKDDLKTQVAALVDDLFNEKEETEIREQTKVELEKAASTISELTSALEVKNTEFSDMEDKLTASETRVTELESELEAAKKELETANEKLGEVEQTLEGIRKDRAAEIRLAELKDAGVARSDKENQMVKVKEMSDEEFASYKNELVSIREAVLAELEASKAEADAKAEAEAEQAKKKAEEDKLNKEKIEASNKENENKEVDEENDETASGDEGTPPAQVTPGQAAMASLNMEYIPSDDVVSKYAKLGEAMAARFKKSE